MIIRNVIQSNRGIAAIEFALILPFLLLLAYGVTEFTRYVYFHQKLETTSARLLNIINQNLNLSLSSIDTIVEASDQIMSPFDTANMTVIISAIQKDNDISPASVMWKVYGKIPEDGTLPESKLPDKGGAVELTGFTFTPRDQVIAIEVIQRYEPLVTFGVVTSEIVSEEPIYKTSYARPRYGAFQFEPK